MWRIFSKKRGTEGEKRRNSNKNSELRVPSGFGTEWDSYDGSLSLSDALNIAKPSTHENTTEK